MMAVNESPCNNLFPLNAMAMHKKNNASGQPDKLAFPVNQKIIEIKTQTNDRL
jgi:hypothetical protein